MFCHISLSDHEHTGNGLKCKFINLQKYDISFLNVLPFGQMKQRN